jgi:uncharacterized protein (TIGR03435 family)
MTRLITCAVALVALATQLLLGLKLESTKGPVNAFVIDRVERPVE